MIKYIGSKRLLLGGIVAAVKSASESPEFAASRDGRTPIVLDLFSGTSRVGHALKAAGYRVIANDHNAYADVLARCYVQADADDVSHDAGRLVAEFNSMPGSAGYMTETFCLRSRYFHPRNGERIDAIREAIATKCLPPELQAVLLTSLMEAADRVDSTTGLQMAYLKQWAPRAHNDLCLRVPKVLPQAPGGKGAAHCLDALTAAALDADIAYIDPPYNQHSYLGNYHVWESLVRWDKPEVYGIACKRIDCRTRPSRFNRRGQCAPALRDLLLSLKAHTVVVSFSNEGYITRPEMEQMLLEFTGHPHDTARIQTTETDYGRYVGAKIGIYNPAGKKVGKVGHLRNKEFLYVAQRTQGLTPKVCCPE